MKAWSKRLGCLSVLLGTTLLVVWGVRLARVGLSLRQHLAQAQVLMNESQAIDPAMACDLVQDLRDDVVALDEQVGGLVRVLPILSWLPGIGEDLRAAPHLLAVADGLTEAGALACDALKPALIALGGSPQDISLEHIVHLLAGEQAALRQAAAAVGRSHLAWEQVDVNDLSPWLARKMLLIDEGLPLLQAGLDAATVVPALLGADGPRTYLILALNEDEQRPIGGYITAAGEVQVEAGRLITMTFRDSYAVDDFAQPYPDPPAPLRRYMGVDLWVFRDSNWSPDFPTAARQAISLYRPGYPVSVDGVIALDQRAVQQLVTAVGPLKVEGEEQPVTGQTVIAYMRRAWAPDDEELTGDWWKQRKSFMGPLAWATWEKVEAGQVDWAALGRALLRLLEEKHVLIYLEHPGSAVLAEQGWDGALRARPGDFLMVVDANVGYNKANAQVQEEIAYQVDLRPSSPQASLILTHTHTSKVGYPCVRETRYDPVYEQMMGRCYWDYLQVYVPQGSQLLDATRIPIAREALFSGEGESGEVVVQQSEEGPWLTFAVLSLIPPSVTQARAFTWTLPSDVVQWDGDEGLYSLWIQKQPGTQDHSLTVQIRLPEGSALQGGNPEPLAVEGDWVIYRMALDRDREFRLYFGRK